MIYLRFIKKKERNYPLSFLPEQIKLTCSDLTLKSN